MSVLGIATLLVACSGSVGSGVTPSPATRQAQYVKMECNDGCNKSGGAPAPAPTPDVAGEEFCVANDGDFLDITGAGGTGLTCSGGNGRAPVVVGTKCGISFHMSGSGQSDVTLPNGNEYVNVRGLEINGDDCSYQLTY